MDGILNEMFAQYVKFGTDGQLEDEVAQCHRTLAERLGEDDLKLVLRIIDNKDVIAGQWAHRSFRTGFWLAWKLVTELNEYDEGRLSEDG